MQSLSAGFVWEELKSKSRTNNHRVFSRLFKYIYVLMLECTVTTLKMDMGVHHTLFLPVIQAGGEYEALQDLKEVINLKLFLISAKKQ